LPFRRSLTEHWPGDGGKHFGREKTKSQVQIENARGTVEQPCSTPVVFNGGVNGGWWLNGGFE